MQETTSATSAQSVSAGHGMICNTGPVHCRRLHLLRLCKASAGRGIICNAGPVQCRRLHLLRLCKGAR